MTALSSPPHRPEAVSCHTVMDGRASAGTPLVVCEWCEGHPDRSCPACAARRRRAVRLVSVEGLSVGEAARQMRLSVARVVRLLEADADRRCVGALVQADVATALLRRLLLDRQRHEPALTVAELARRLGSSQVAGRALAGAAGDRAQDRPARAQVSRPAVGARERRDRRADRARDRLRARMRSTDAEPRPGQTSAVEPASASADRCAGRRSGVGIAAMGCRRRGQAAGGRVPMIWVWRAERRAGKPLRGDRVLMTGRTEGASVRSWGA